MTPFKSKYQNVHYILDIEAINKFDNTIYNSRDFKTTVEKLQINLQILTLYKNFPCTIFGLLLSKSLLINNIT